MSRLRSWALPLLAGDRRVDVVGGRTLALLLLTTQQVWGLQIVLVPLVVAAVVDRRLMRAPGYWHAVLVVYAVGVAPSSASI